MGRLPKDLVVGHRLIADFLVTNAPYWDKDPDQDELYFQPHDTKFQQMKPKEMKFNVSWEWLMPVIEIIGETCRIEMEKDEEDSICAFEGDDGYIGDTGQWNIGLTLIESAYYSVVEYVKWFNSSN